MKQPTVWLSIVCWNDGEMGFYGYRVFATQALAEEHNKRGIAIQKGVELQYCQVVELLVYGEKETNETQSTNNN